MEMRYACTKFRAASRLKTGLMLPTFRGELDRQPITLLNFCLARRTSMTVAVCVLVVIK